MTTNKTVKISFHVDKQLYDERINKMPWGVRSSVLRTLLLRIIDAADKHGQMIYGAILDGDFEIKYKKHIKEKE